MIKVLFFDLNLPTNPYKVGRFEVHNFQLAPFLKEESLFRNMSKFFHFGTNAAKFGNSIRFAQWIDDLYRNRDKTYMALIEQFISAYKEFDIIVMANWNFVHPEVFLKHFKNTKKILGFVDDPHSSYTRGIPYLWAFDGAIYISPSYSSTTSMEQALKNWGCDNIKWWPLVQVEYPKKEKVEYAFFSERFQDLCYVGNYYGTKLDRLIDLKRTYGNGFQLHGRWPLNGYYGFVRPLLGKAGYFQRVQGISNDTRRDLYWDTKIGFNMHQSDSAECGNMRTYEVPAHGALLLSDRGGLNFQASIFKENEEAIYYDSLKDAKDKIKYFLSPCNEKERVEIAKNSYYKFWERYELWANLESILDWASNIELKGA
jgi:Glycosyl transferases group 1